MTAALAGRLRQRIRIEEPLVEPDSSGGPGNRWRKLGDWWAEVRPVEGLAQSTVTGDTRVTARRWRVLARAGMPARLGLRLLWRGLDLRVVGVELDPAEPDRILVIAEEFGS
ncbi:MAG: head-tail adaptor protein [Sphingomonadaceae bacterium]|uniref:phage head completion protein n=1 Tax=Thermaurantiacus sp. TaxID=2820283 RepID=UPI00298F2034|nr:head-tail adaptor protein [Thermaurantiacus sp.]MCS6987766.1 head-tail adaptor protein [Sphingomonadaceae bacterium]MDW8415013.1 head-tail adaptor protein [Thermaurantiacus sp.]